MIMDQGEPATGEDGGQGRRQPSPRLPAMISYAQNLEDVLLRRAFSKVGKGFYIDVGAQDPVKESVTKFFYEQGWRGINIEPVAPWFEKLKADRPEDVNLRIALGSKPGRLPLFEIGDTGLSTTVPEIAALHRQAGYDPKAGHEVEVDTLDAVCARHGVGTVHFLKIDVEGAEAEVLQGLSLDKIRPWIILVEATVPNSQETTHHEWEPLLTGHGYAFVWFDGLNRYFVADEHEELKSAFGIQPNVFDNYVRHAEAVATGHAAALDQDLRSAREENGLLLVERDRHLQEIDRLRGEIDRAANDVARLTREGKLLQEELAQARTWQRIAEEQKVLLKHSETLIQTTELLRTHIRTSDAAHRAEGEARARIAELEHTIALLRGEITALRQSVSWKLTAPLRFNKLACLGLRGAGAPSGPERAQMQAYLLRLARRAAEQPVLRRIAVALLARHPDLKRRLAARLTAMPYSPATYPATQSSPLLVPPLSASPSDAQCQAWNAFSRAMAARERP
jgi:FkbM family methyltransferase